MKITVIGQGYVGLPLAIAASQNSYIVSGFDINAEKIVQLSKGKSPIEDLKNEDIASAIAPSTRALKMSSENLPDICKAQYGSSAPKNQPIFSLPSDCSITGRTQLPHSFAPDRSR